MRLPSFPGGIALLTILTTVAAQGIAFAFAEPAEVPTVVLGLEALDGAPDNVASEITDALRQRVASAKGHQLVQGKDLVEVKLVFSCPDEAPACMSQAGKSMGASKLIFGNVKRAGADYQVTLKLLDVNRGTVEAWAAETVPRRKAESSVFRSLAPAWFAKLTGKGNGGSLQIRANVAGAAVSLDGTRVGVTGKEPVVVSEVAPGRHEVGVEKSGYTNTKQEFTLAGGQSLPLSLTLSAVSVEVGAPPPGETAPVLVRRPREDESPGTGNGGSHTAARATFWVAVVGTLGATGAGLYFANDVKQTNSDLNQYRRIKVGDPGCPSSNTGVCDINGVPKQPRTPQENLIVADKMDHGKRAQTFETICLVSAVPLAIASGYFLYRGYLDGSGETTTASRGLRIFPTASASAGGIVTEFDF
jgi:PEGA domain